MLLSVKGKTCHSNWLFFGYIFFANKTHFTQNTHTHASLHWRVAVNASIFHYFDFRFFFLLSINRNRYHYLCSQSRFVYLCKKQSIFITFKHSNFEEKKKKCHDSQKVQKHIDCQVRKVKFKNTSALMCLKHCHIFVKFSLFSCVVQGIFGKWLFFVFPRKYCARQIFSTPSRKKNDRIKNKPSAFQKPKSVGYKNYDRKVESKSQKNGSPYLSLSYSKRIGVRCTFDKFSAAFLCEWVKNKHHDMYIE